MKCPFCIKVCTKCGKLLVAYSGNFRKDKNGKLGLYPSCKICNKKQYKQYYEENKEKKQQYYEEHKDYYEEYRKQYYQEHKEEHKERCKQWAEEHKEEIAEYHAQYYQEHKEEKAEERAEYNKQWRENNPHKVFNQHNKRRQLEENQGRGITGEQWYEMMCWFDWCCAYSGEYLGGDNKNKRRTIDHIVALDNGGLNEPYNCVPMYKSYNTSKSNKDMEEWYRQQEYFSEERLQKIYEWCEYAYKKWGDYEEI